MGSNLSDMFDQLRRADLHLHSSASFDVPDLPTLRPRALFEKALGHPDPARRMDWFVLTDHDTLAGYEALCRELPETDRRLLVPAVEHTLRDAAVGFTIHTNLYGIAPETYADLRATVETVDELLSFCAEHGVWCQYNHPTWWERHELRHRRVDFSRVPQLAERFDVLELNASRTPAQNLVTISLADELGLPLTAGSDSHTGDLGRAWTAAPGDHWRDFLAAVWRGEGETHLESLSYTSLLHEASTVIDDFLDQQAGDGNARCPHHQGQAWLESLATRVVTSGWVQRSPRRRETLRRLLKGISRPIMRKILGHERRLEDRIAASSLSTYLRRTTRRRAA